MKATFSTTTVATAALIGCLLLVGLRLNSALWVGDHEVTAVFAVELCEELRKNGYSDEAKRLEARLYGRAEQFTANLTPEQWDQISKRKFQ